MPLERDSNTLQLKLGEKAPYFSLKGTDGKIHTISDFLTTKAFVVIFTCNHCPYAQSYEKRLISLAKDYQPRGAQFVAICANDSVGFPEDDFNRMVEKSSQLSLPYPYLHDESQAVAKAYDAACTPETYVFDSQHRLQYHGRIDDNYRQPEQVKSHDLRDAIEAVLAGETPKHQLTSAIGCSIKWKR